MIKVGIKDGIGAEKRGVTSHRTGTGRRVGRKAGRMVNSGKIGMIGTNDGVAKIRTTHGTQKAETHGARQKIPDKIGTGQALITMTHRKTPTSMMHKKIRTDRTRKQ